MKKLFPFAVVLLAAACQTTPVQTVMPAVTSTNTVDYADWYVMNAPIDRPISGVWGDIDKTVLITTGDALYRSVDRGKSWTAVHRQSQGMQGLVQYHDTLYAMMGLSNETALNTPGPYSVNDGVNWKLYTAHNPAFDVLAYKEGYPTFAVNPVKANNGTGYAIYRDYYNNPSTKVGDFETPGVIVNGQRRVNLPLVHQLNSVYLDTQQRLYVTGSDAVCGRGINFTFCNSKGGRGVVYVSKKSLP